MNYLFLDIASHEGIIACANDTSVVASHACTNRLSDHELIPCVEKMLKQANWSYKDFTHIACVIGPGGFTSLRVAVAFANTLSDQLDIPAAGVHLSDLYSARIPNPQSPILWVHSTKKSELFARTFDCDPWPEPTHLTLEEFIKQAPKSTQWCGELIEEHAKEIIELGGKEVELSDPLDVLPVFLSKLEYNKDPLQPWYGRGF